MQQNEIVTDVAGVVEVIEVETQVKKATRRLRNEQGFSMIELVIGLVVLAVLAGVTMGFAGMIGDSAQRNMEKTGESFAAAMAKHYADFGRYPTAINTDANATSSATSIAFQPSTGVGLTFPSAPTTASWTVAVTHDKRAGMTCRLTVRDFGAAPMVCTGGT